MNTLNIVTPLTLLFILFFSSSTASTTVYNVVELGAKSDGKTDSTNAFIEAWTSACNSVGSATIIVPHGQFLVKNVIFDGKDCRNSDITISMEGATLVAPSDYNVMRKSENWIRFGKVKGVSIQGGTLDGRGTSLWDCKLADGKHCPDGTRSLKFSNCEDVKIEGLTSINSQKFHIVIYDSHNVKMHGVTIRASSDSPNTDGIHVESSTDVTINRADIGTGDDCISIGPGTKNLWMENIICGPGHGISIGSLGKRFNEQGVQNVTVKTATFTGTQSGVRIKTWAKPCNGFVKDVLFQDLMMNQVKNPILIDQHYCPHNKGCPTQVSGVKISQVTYSGIRGTSATQVAVKFDCSSKKPCSGIIMENVNLIYQNRPAQSSCSSIDGSAYGVIRPLSCL
ncbi:hypothetical protein IFM89_004782 [Coptis chinensis]|uniref:Polygalacturonase n=1 Tax=Coptis chinensis TaxID=261450 RepID=A0A835I9W0_9MAGN|nr:hypothetical protein IFM89_004782 [Coptis chinensis]